jgi:hypothetical protein
MEVNKVVRAHTFVLLVDNRRMHLGYL